MDWNDFGIIPPLNEVLPMSLKVNEMCLLANFNILIGIDEGPDVLESTSEEMVGYNNKE